MEGQIGRHLGATKITYDGEWYCAECSSLPGAVSQGRTRAEAERNIASAIGDLLGTYDMFGMAVPRPRLSSRRRP
jgi:Uncharacterized conserved protein